MLHAECPVIIFNGHICLQAPFEKSDMNRIDYWPEARKKPLRVGLQFFPDTIQERFFTSGTFFQPCIFRFRNYSI